MAINRIGTVSIFVRDQSRARQFYTDVLGMEVRTDQPLGPDSDARWLAVAPPGADTEIILYLVDKEWEHYSQTVGETQALTLDVTDMQALYEDLRARGVRFVQAPDVQPWGTFAIVEDSEGNRLLLVEQPERPPQNKAELLDRIERSFGALEEVLSNLGESQLTARGPEGWSIKDHLAHLTTWELGVAELLLRRSRYAAMGVEEAVSAGKTTDEINELIFRRRQHRTLTEILDDFQAVHEQMVQVLERMGWEDLMQPYVSFLPEGATGPQEPVINWVAGNTYGHFEEHRGWILRLLEEI